jgi:hypothetical protein
MLEFTEKARARGSIDAMEESESREEEEDRAAVDFYEGGIG